MRLVLLLLYSLVTKTSDAEFRTKLLGFHEVIPIETYKYYRNAAFIKFNLPANILNASFVFEAETKKSSLLSCKPLPVEVHLQYGAFPVIAADGSKFPETFANVSRSKIYKKEFISDGAKNYINVTGPMSGEWFGMAFRTFIPKKDRQIGLSDFKSVCTCLMNTYLMVTYADVQTLRIGSTQTFEFENEQILKIDVANTNFNYVKITFQSPFALDIYIRPNGIPDKNKQVFHYFQTTPKRDKVYILNTDLYPLQYILINNTPETAKPSVIIKTEIIKQDVEISQQQNISDEFEAPKQLSLRLPSNSTVIYNEHDLLQMRSRKMFVFSYIIQPNLQLKSPKLLNLTVPLTVLRFKIGSVDEVGGTLYLGFSLNPLRVAKNLTSKYKAVICVRLNAIEIPALPNTCVYKYDVHQAPMILNSSDPIGTYENIHIPFPEIGIWYISIGVFDFNFDTELTKEESDYIECGQKNETCVKFCRLGYSKCLDYCSEQACPGVPKLVNDTLVTELYKDWTNRNISKFNASVIFSVAMAPCVDELCGTQGECAIQFDGSLAFSTCKCHNDYQGWDCQDNSEVSSPFMAFIDTFLLVGSNIGFAGSGYYAIKRGYHAEATVYFFVLFFSSIYHLCDAGKGIYTLCILPNSILKFCDFYCGLLSIWMTTIAIANLNTKLKGVCHMAGSIFLVMGVTFNMESIFVFAAPLVCGFLITSVNWWVRYKQLKLYPTKSYLMVNLPGGILLVVFGVACFAFLETDSNYKFIHSLWHMLMAMSVILLLPSHNTFVNKQS